MQTVTSTEIVKDAPKAPVPEADKPTRARVKPLNGFYKLWRLDMERIRQHGEQDAEAESISIPTLMAIWAALCDIANDKRSNTFTISIGIIRKTAGVARCTTFVALDVLEKLGMVKAVSNSTTDASGKVTQKESTYTIYPTEKAPTKAGVSSDKKTRPSSDKKTPPSPNHRHVSSDTALKNLQIHSICRGKKEGGEAISLNNPRGTSARALEEAGWGPS
jgi:hypothetical protein